MNAEHPELAAAAAAAKLTPKQEAFAVAVGLRGMSQTDAYLAVFDAKTMKRTTAQVRASELARSPEIEARITELRTVRVSESVASKQELLEGFTNLFRGKNTDGGTTYKPLKMEDRIRAGEILARLLGIDTAVKGGTLNIIGSINNVVESARFDGKTAEWARAQAAEIVADIVREGDLELWAAKTKTGQ